MCITLAAGADRTLISAMVSFIPMRSALIVTQKTLSSSGL